MPASPFPFSFGHKPRAGLPQGQPRGCSPLLHVWLVMHVLPSSVKPVLHLLQFLLEPSQLRQLSSHLQEDTGSFCCAGRGPGAARTPPGAPLPSCLPCNCDSLKPQTSVCTFLHPPDCTIALRTREDGHGQWAEACQGLMGPGPSGSRIPCGSPGHFLGHCGTCPTAGSSSNISTRTPGQLPSSEL